MARVRVRLRVLVRLRLMVRIGISRGAEVRDRVMVI